LGIKVGDEGNEVDEYDDSHKTGKEIPYHGFNYSEAEIIKRSQLFYESMKLRRSVRRLSSRSIPVKVIQNLIKTAGTPW